MKKLLFLGLLCGGGVVLFSHNAFSRVCFLPGGSDDEFCLGSLPVYHSLKCPGFTQTCEHPKYGSKSCSDLGVDLYNTPADCCESSSFYEVCPGKTVCEAGYECSSADGFASCDVGHCTCPDNYRLCDGEGLIGRGESCTDSEGTKYSECVCDQDKYFDCQLPAEGSGESCRDNNGTWYTECTCPTNYEWFSSPDDCLCGTKDVCTNLPSGTKVFTCQPQPVLDCKCGYVLNGGCPTGCTDNSFEYIGSIPTGIACETTQKGLSNNTCSKNCSNATCPNGYNVRYQTASDCTNPAGSGWEVTFNGQSGTQRCGKCECHSTCKFNDQNKGNATLSEPCCNGNYNTCTSKCGAAKTPPENASCSEYCTGCDQPEICTAWACNAGYSKNTAGTSCVKDCAYTLTADSCSVGDVYYNNKRCGKAADYEPKGCNTLIPIGVVYQVSANGLHGKIISLHNLGVGSRGSAFDPEDPFNTKGGGFVWGSYGRDIADLNNNVSSDAMISKLKDANSELFDGKGNTAKILATATSLADAAVAAHAFYPPNTDKNDPDIGAGQWYLPAIGELMILYGYDISRITGFDGSSGADATTRSVVNSALMILKNKDVVVDTLETAYNWSSTEYNGYSAWLLRMGTGYRTSAGKNGNYFILVSLEF